MPSINKAVILGRLGNQPEIRNLNNGQVANFSVATSEGWKDKSGDWKEQTEWHRVVTYNERHIGLCERLNKGAMVYLEGKIRTRKWKDNSGAEKYTTEIVLGKWDSVLMALEKRETSRSGKAPQGEEAQTVAEELLDNVPF